MFSTIKKYLFSLFLFSQAGYLFSQTTLQYPISFSQFFNQYSIINPAATAADAKFTFRSGEQVHSGYFSRVRSFYASGEYSFKKDLKLARNALGLSFMNNVEGSILSFNRTYLQYAYYLPLSEQLTVSAGAALGFVNFHADQTSTSGSVSSFAPDASIGLMLSSKQHRFGISSGQIFNKSILVVTEQIPISRFYRFYYTDRFFISPVVSFLPAVLYTLRKEGGNIDLNASFLIRDLVAAGISYRYRLGTSYFFGFKDFNFMKGKTNLMFSYNAPWPSGVLGNVQSFEITLSYSLL